jgi:hypothetical protein
VPAIKIAVKNIGEYPAEDGSFSRSAFVSASGETSSFANLSLLECRECRI